MKKTLQTVLIFAVILAGLLGIAALAERLRPAAEEVPVVEETAAPEKTVANAMTPDSATLIELRGDSVALAGVGAEAHGGVVTIAYPGTYRVRGSLEAGQLVVDLGDFDGGVYLLLDGASIACPDGPALFVKQADLTVVQLVEGTENSLRDGAGYEIVEGELTDTGAALYSRDDLLIEGEGALTVTGASSDGIRSKDALTITGGTLTVYSADDGIQASDRLAITGGAITVGSYGDGLATTQGGIEITGGALNITSAGDGVAAFAELSVSGDSAVKVTSYGGAAHYAEIAIADRSAKGLKGANIVVTGGSFDLNTADDAIHAGQNAAISGGLFAIASGDDAVSAETELSITGGAFAISESYEALEGDTVLVSDVSIRASAVNNGVSAGAGGFAAANAELVLDAPRAVSAEGEFALRGGSLLLTADGSDSLFAFAAGEVVGGTVIAVAGSNDRGVLLEKGELPGSLLFLFQDPVAAGTELVLADAAGTPILAFSLESDASAVLLCSGALGAGQTYVLTAGENVMEATVSDGCAVVEPEGGLVTASAEMGAFGGFFGGPRR